LDTSHLSELARHPTDPEPAEVIRLLQSGDVALGVSLFHLVELADPEFKSVDDIRVLLGDVQHVLANPYQEVEEEEMAVACARAVGLRRRPPKVWASDAAEWGFAGGPVSGNAIDLLDAFRVSEVRNELLELCDYGARSSMLKSDAALVRSPLFPLTLALQDHIDNHRRGCPDYAAGLDAQMVLDRVGGKRAFPGYEVQEALMEQRMKDAGQKSTRNDVLDEYIAFYAPYAAVTTVDRRTLHRTRAAGLTTVTRMTRHLSEVPVILRRVAEGELGYEPSAEWSTSPKGRSAVLRAEPLSQPNG
jgi:hypothetical protein